MKNAYIIKGEEVIRNPDGEIEEIICTYDPLSKSGSGSKESQRKVKGTLHWVTRLDSLPIQINLYDRLFSIPEPDKNKDQDISVHFNQQSFEISNGYIEPHVLNSPIGSKFQFQHRMFILKENTKANSFLTKQLVFVLI